MCDINIKQDRKNASSTLGVNQQQFPARAGENAVVTHTAPERRNLVAKPSLKAITWSDLKLHRNTASQYLAELSVTKVHRAVTPPVLCEDAGQGFYLPKPSTMVSYA